MSRTSNDQRDANGNLINGFDYANQAWVKDGRYVRCGHPESMDCGCFGREHAGEPVIDTKCPQCNGEDEFCGFCNGTGKVSRSQASEWHRQNPSNEAQS
jgi:hypothetical protein